MIFDALIIGGGAAGISCALILGSAKQKAFGKDKKTGIIMHQKASHLQEALLNNALGIKPGTTGKEILEMGKQQLQELYPEVEQIYKEKVTEVIFPENEVFQVVTNKSCYKAKIVVIAVGYSNLMRIKGLEPFIVKHEKAKPSKQRIQLKNKNHLIQDGLYVAGTLAGWRSQFAIAAGSGAAVATDILTLWNNGVHTKIHDKIKY